MNMETDMNTCVGTDMDNHVKQIVLTEESLNPKKKRNKKKKNKNEETYEDICDNDSLCSNDYDDDDKRPTRKNRVITQTKKWETMQQHLTKENQLQLLIHIADNVKSPECVYMLQEIHRKINGYKAQDIEKHLYDPEHFVDQESVITLLLRSELQCYYCKEDMHVLYAEVRNPKQWSLERIDNTYGHNKENVEIACLQCNLKRKTMYHERFLFTKQLGNIVKLG